VLAPAEPRPARAGRRGRLLLRLLLVHGDVFALLASFFVAQRITGTDPAGGVTGTGFLFILSIPAWIVAAKAAGLYDRDEDLINHSTVDELPVIFRLVTIGTWLFFAIA
jgi:hypothetical protein